MKAKHYIILSLVVLIVGFVYVRFYWEFGSGTKAGVLNTFQNKGYIFKTYEGKIIQSGFKANVQSNEFLFSVVDDNVANILLKNPGREMVLHYKSFFGALPWRGLQSDIVDSVYEIRGVTSTPGINPQ